MRPPAKLDDRLRDSTGVRRRLERDGLGREAWRWIANALIDGKQHSRRWSVDKHGDRGAWRLAMAQRREWEDSKNMSVHPTAGETLDAYHLIHHFGRGVFGEVWLC